MNRRTTETYMVQVIYGDESFEDRYVEATSGEEAIKMVRREIPRSRARWARFMI